MIDYSDLEDPEVYEENPDGPEASGPVTSDDRYQDP